MPRAEDKAVGFRRALTSTAMCCGRALKKRAQKIVRSCLRRMMLAVGTGSCPATALRSTEWAVVTRFAVTRWSGCRSHEVLSAIGSVAYGDRAGALYLTRYWRNKYTVFQVLSRALSMFYGCLPCAVTCNIRLLIPSFSALCACKFFSNMASKGL